MSMGTGIFLSSLILGIIILFIGTKDRWNWKKIILWPLAVVLGLAVLGGVGAFFYSEYKDRPRIQEKFWDITLEDSKADIKFRKGEPRVVEEGLWTYKETGIASNDWAAYQVSFDGDKVWYVLCEGFKCPKIQGMRFDYTLSKISARFGEPSRVAVSGDQLERIYSYDRYHVFFILKRDKVRAYGIFNPAVGFLGYRKDKEESKTDE